jgi:hypothetical protein
MVALAAECRGELAPTRSYDRRSYSWVPADPGVFDEHVDGCLTIFLTHTGKRIVRNEVFVYAVEVEWEAAVDFGLRSFLLENFTEPDEYGPFRCVVGGLHDWCQCEAGRISAARGESASCKHVSALLDLLNKGVCDERNDDGFDGTQKRDAHEVGAGAV